jgi:hypothetical protein
MIMFADKGSLEAPIQLTSAHDNVFRISAAVPTHSENRQRHGRRQGLAMALRRALLRADVVETFMARSLSSLPSSHGLAHE